MTEKASVQVNRTTMVGLLAEVLTLEATDVGSFTLLLMHEDGL